MSSPSKLPCKLVTLDLSKNQDFKMSQYTQNCPSLIKDYLNTPFRSVYTTYQDRFRRNDFTIDISIGINSFSLRGNIETYSVINVTSPYYIGVSGSNVSFSGGVGKHLVLFKDAGTVYQLENIFDSTRIYRDGYPYYYLISNYIWTLQIIGRQSYYKNGTEESYIGDIRNELSLLNINNNPIIDITSQLLIDESDIGHTIFNVVSKTTQTFIKGCPKIVNVLKGKGDTMWDKLNYLYVTNPPGILGYDFIAKIVRYSMLKYILGKLLYGVFDKKYILNKNFKKFLKDLGKSQYNNYVPFFTTGEYKNYYKYFLYDNHDNLKI